VVSHVTVVDEARLRHGLTLLGEKVWVLVSLAIIACCKHQSGPWLRRYIPDFASWFRKNEEAHRHSPAATKQAPRFTPVVGAYYLPGTYRALIEA
jgi:hypothetical protein